MTDNEKLAASNAAAASRGDALRDATRASRLLRVAAAILEGLPLKDERLDGAARHLIEAAEALGAWRPHA